MQIYLIFFMEGHYFLDIQYVFKDLEKFGSGFKCYLTMQKHVGYQKSKNYEIFVSDFATLLFFYRLILVKKNIFFHPKIFLFSFLICSLEAGELFDRQRIL